MGIVQVPSPNRGGQRSVTTRIVLHLMDGTLAGTDAWFQAVDKQGEPVAKASAHFGIGKKGEIHQYVPLDCVAWHAGRVADPSVKLPPGNPNYYSIGIEHEGRAKEHLPLELYIASARLLRALAAKYQIPLDSEHVLLHREIYAKKECPGTLDRGLLLQMAKHIEPDQITLGDDHGGGA